MGTSIQFKFILRGVSGEISWQPGPDRCLQTRETMKTMVVWEDWEDALKQKILEEEEAAASFICRDSDTSSNRSVVAIADVINDALDSIKITSEDDHAKLQTTFVGDPVLVPGLAPCMPLPSAVAVHNKGEEFNAFQVNV